MGTGRDTSVTAFMTLEADLHVFCSLQQIEMKNCFPP
jgi:hypothetical protein